MKKSDNSGSSSSAPGISGNRQPMLQQWNYLHHWGTAGSWNHILGGYVSLNHQYQDECQRVWTCHLDRTAAASRVDLLVLDLKLHPTVNTTLTARDFVTSLTSLTQKKNTIWFLIICEKYPGESFGLKFIPNQSEKFRTEIVSAPNSFIPSNPKLIFNPNQSETHSKSIRTCNPNESVKSELIRMYPINPNETEFFGIFRIESDRLDSFVLKVRVNPDWPDSIGFFRISSSDWFWMGLNWWFELKTN